MPSAWSHRRQSAIGGTALQDAGSGTRRSFETQLIHAARQFVVRRDQGKTVIAGYPWFLDWGRDSLICARGLLAAGMAEDVRQALLTFARFEENGTMPNTIHGDDASNRDTSDAPLWFAIACEELANQNLEFTRSRGNEAQKKSEADTSSVTPTSFTPRPLMPLALFVTCFARSRKITHAAHRTASAWTRTRR